MIDFIYLVLDRCAAVTYIFMTLVASVTPFVPILKSLACYGKTRYGGASNSSSSSSSMANQDRNDKNNNNRKRTSLIMEIWNGFLVPKQFFTHFYVAGIVSFLCHRGYCGWRFRQRDGSFSVTSAVEILLMVHLCRRLLECLTVHEWRRGSQMHLAVYLGGLMYYFFLPFLLFPLLLVDGGENDGTTPSWQTDASSSYENSRFRFVSRTGLLSLFCSWAQFQQSRHHWILANLRRRRPKNIT